MNAHWLALGILSGVGLVACGSSTSGGSPTTAPVAGQPTAPSGPVPASGALPWPAPPGPMARAQAAGLVPETAERLQYHVHAHLDVFLDGVAQVVPAGIGINIADPAVHTVVTDGKPSYGGISTPCAQPCISPLHTHDESGVLHTESATRADNTLGQFFVEWGVTLTAACVGGYCSPAWPVAVYVDGQVFRDDPRAIALSNGKEIAVVIGRPPAQVPATVG